MRSRSTPLKAAQGRYSRRGGRDQTERRPHPDQHEDWLIVLDDPVHRLKGAQGVPPAEGSNPGHHHDSEGENDTRDEGDQQSGEREEEV